MTIFSLDNPQTALFFFQTVQIQYILKQALLLFETEDFTRTKYVCARTNSQSSFDSIETIISRT